MDNPGGPVFVNDANPNSPMEALEALRRARDDLTDIHVAMFNGMSHKDRCEFLFRSVLDISNAVHTLIARLDTRDH